MDEEQIDHILEILKKQKVHHGEFILDMNQAIQALKKPLPLPEATVSAMMILIGRDVKVRVNDGSLYSGIFYVPPVQPVLGIQLLGNNLKENTMEKNKAETKSISLDCILQIVGKGINVLVDNGEWNIVNTEEPQALKENEKIDTEKIARGEDIRTSLMIKNIPKRYTSEMLIAEINKNSQGTTYDFFHLPVKINKRHKNVGYAFINMVSPLDIIRFYQDFNGRKWDNSVKVASLSYAKSQGMDALLEAYQKSSNSMTMGMQLLPTLFLTKEQHQERIRYSYLKIATREPKQGDMVESSKARSDEKQEEEN